LSSEIKSILPVSLLSGIGALLIRFSHQSINLVGDKTTQVASTLEYSKDVMVSNAELAGSSLVSSSENILFLGSPFWWFIGGVLLSIIVFIFVNSLIKLEGNYGKKINNLEKFTKLRDSPDSIKQLKGGNKNGI
jgi:hypothetical protein